MKKALSLIMAIMMAVSVLPFGTFAEEQPDGALTEPEPAAGIVSEEAGAEEPKNEPHQGEQPSSGELPLPAEEEPSVKNGPDDNGADFAFEAEPEPEETSQNSSEAEPPQEVLPEGPGEPAGTELEETASEGPEEEPSEGPEEELPGHELTLRELKNAAVKEGKAEFTVTVADKPENAVPMYQWQRLDTSVSYENALERAEAWEDIPGETSCKLTFTDIEEETYLSEYRSLLFRCLVRTEEDASLTEEVRLLPDPDWAESEENAPEAAPEETPAENEETEETAPAALTPEYGAENPDMRMPGEEPAEAMLFGNDGLLSQNGEADTQNRQLLSSTIASGTCGQSVSWELSENGLLTVSGNGNMAEYTLGNVPWAKYADKIRYVRVEEGVTSLSKFSFYGCGGLTVAVLPSTLTAMGNACFGGCTALKQISIPRQITVIPENCFTECSSLESISIGDGLREVQESAFCDCTALTNVYYSGTREQWGNIDIDPVENSNLLYANIIISIPAEAVALFNAEGENVSGREVYIDRMLGTTYALTAVTEPEEADRPVFTSSDPETATVGQGGLVTFLRSGKVTVTAEAAAGPSASVTFRVYDSRETITLSHSYLMLKDNGTATLTARIQPEELGLTPVWTSSDKEIATVTNGVVYAAGSKGCAYIRAEVTVDGHVCFAECRVDVYTEPEQEIASVQLVTKSAKANVYKSSGYAEVKIVPVMAGNLMLSSAEKTENTGAGITAARFVNENANLYFTLRVKDDRTLEIIPTETAVEAALAGSKALAAKYTSKLILTAEGKEYTTSGSLTLTVVKTKPTLKSKTVTLNSYKPVLGESSPIVFASGHVEEVLATGIKPAWLTFDAENMTLALSKDTVPARYNNGTLKLTCDADGWSIPATVSVPYTVKKTVPKITFSIKSGTVLPESRDALRIGMKVTPALFDNAELYPVKVKRVEEKVGKKYEKVDIFELDCLNALCGEGLLTVHAPSYRLDGKAHSYRVVVGILDREYTVTVKTPARKTGPVPALKQTGGIHTKVEGSACVLTASAKNFHVEIGEKYRLEKITMYKGSALVRDDASDAFKVTQSGNTFTITEKAPGTLQSGYTYKAVIGVTEVRNAGSGETDGTAAVTLKITNDRTVPAVSVTAAAKGSIDVARPGSSIRLTPSVKNWAGEAAFSLAFFEKIGKKTYERGEGEYPFGVADNGDGTFTITAGSCQTVTSAWTVAVRAEVNGNVYTSKPVKLTVKKGTVKVKASSASAVLYKNDRNSRVNIALSIADAAVAPIDRVTLDAVSAKKLQLVSLGNNTYALEYRDNALPASFKAATAKLSVFVEGCTVPAATVKVKVSYSQTSPAKYTITFNANGGSIGTSSRQYLAGIPLGELPKPVRSYYTFDGWYTAAVGGTKVDVSYMRSATSGITLYAHWLSGGSEWSEWSEWGVTPVTPDDNTRVETRTVYRYFYYTCPNCGAHMHASGTCYTWVGGCGGSVPSSAFSTVWLTVPYSSASDWLGTGAFTVDDPKSGTVFCFRSGSNFVAPRTEYRHSTRDTSEDIKTYIMTFEANGGSCSATSMNGVVGSAIGTLPVPTRTGYTFKGWYTAAAGGTKIEAGYKHTTTASITVFAQWEIITYTMTFNANGGSCSMASKGFTVVTPVGTLPTPTRSGYTFKGWYTAATGGSRIETSYKNAGSITVYAQWQMNSTYTMTFNANGGSCSVGSKTGTTGAAIGTLPTPTRNYYTFSGWYTSATGGTLISSTYTQSTTANITVYAHWTAQTYTMTFNANGGTCDTASKICPVDTSIGTLPTPTRNYYTFNGWYTAAIGGTKISSTYKQSTTAGITVYAHWTQNPELGPVLVSSVPVDAQVTRNVYSYHQTAESESSTMPGWTGNGSHWVQTGTGSTDYASFPSGFRTSHSIYQNTAKSPYTASETETTKREVSNKTNVGYIYWHWMYNVAWAHGTTRAIRNAQGTGEDNGFAYSYFYAFKSTTNFPSAGTGYCNSKGIESFNCYNWTQNYAPSADKNSSTSGLGTDRFFRFSYSTSTYTDYKKVYDFYKDVTYSSTNPAGLENVSNIRTYAYYRMK